MDEPKKPSKPTKPRPNEVLTGLQSSWRGKQSVLKDIFELILEPMMERYYPPLYAEDDIELLDGSIRLASDYAALLEPFSYDALRHAWLVGIRKHTVSRWPAVALFVEAAEAFGGNTPHPAGSDRYRRPTEEESKILLTCGSEFYRAVASDPHGLINNSAMDRAVRMLRNREEFTVDASYWADRNREIEAAREGDRVIDAHWRGIHERPSAR